MCTAFRSAVRAREDAFVMSVKGTSWMDALRIARSLCLSVRWIWDTEVMVMKGNGIVIAQTKVRFVDSNMLF